MSRERGLGRGEAATAATRRVPSAELSWRREADVENECGGGDEGGGRGRAESGERAAGCREADSGEHEGVRQRPAAEGEERDGDDRERTRAVPRDREEPRREQIEVFLRRRDAGSGHRRAEWSRDRDSEREAGVQESGPRGRAAPDQEQGAHAEEWCGEQAAEQVVDTEGAPVPAVRGAPRERRRGERVGAEARGPGSELGRVPLPPARGQGASEPQCEEGGAEGEESLHGAQRTGSLTD